MEGVDLTGKVASLAVCVFGKKVAHVADSLGWPTNQFLDDR